MVVGELGPLLGKEVSLALLILLLGQFTEGYFISIGLQVFAGLGRAIWTNIYKKEIKGGNKLMAA